VSKLLDDWHRCRNDVLESEVERLVQVRTRELEAANANAALQKSEQTW
jgi:ATP/maltotriose-dependent transcriptional regulator MalT